jgi:hypothetical protein
MANIENLLVAIQPLMQNIREGLSNDNNLVPADE